MSQSIFIQVRFRVATELGDFSSAIFYSEAEWASTTQADIDAAIKLQTNSYIDDAKNPKAFLSPTAAELITVKADLQAEISEKQSEVVKLDAQIIEAQANASDVTVPTKPINLVVGKPSSTQVNFKWQPSTDNIGIVGYNVFRDAVRIANVAAENYTDLKVLPDTSYEYQVQAIDKVGNVSVLSDKLKVKTDKAVK